MLFFSRSHAWYGRLAFSLCVCLPSLSWAEGFSDALTSAYQRNPQLQVARRNYEGQSEQVAKAMAGFFPNAGATYERGYQDTKLGGLNLSGSTDTRGLNVEQPLFNGGRTYHEVKSARRLVEAGQAELANSEQNVLLAAGTAYMDLFAAMAQWRINQRNLILLQENRRMTAERTQLGETTHTDLEQAESRLLQATASLGQSEGQVQDAGAVYLRATGSQAPESLALPEAIPMPPETLEAALATAKQNNLQLASARKRHEAAEYDVDASFGNLLPRVSLVGSTTRQEGGGDSVFAGGNRYEADAVLLRVSIPLYQSGSEYAQIRQNKAEREQRRFEVQDAEERTRQDVARSWQRWQTAQHTLGANRGASQAAQRALAGVREEQKLGERTTLDVLDAERESFQSQIETVRSAHDEIVARLNLLALLGQMNAQNLHLPVEPYDAIAIAEKARFHPIGF